MTQRRAVYTRSPTVRIAEPAPSALCDRAKGAYSWLVAIASAGAQRSRANLDEFASAKRLEGVRLGRTSVALWLIAIAGLSVVLRIVLLSEVHGPWIFLDEL